MKAFQLVLSSWKSFISVSKVFHFLNIKRKTSVLNVIFGSSHNAFGESQRLIILSIDLAKMLLIIQ